MSNQGRTTHLVWVGRAISGILILLFTLSAAAKFFAPVEPRMAAVGIPESLLIPLGILELLCVLAYLVPATSVLGAVLFTGYLGGAILTHLRVGQGFVPQVILGILIWAGLYLREPRLWQLLPLRRMPTGRIEMGPEANRGAMDTGWPAPEARLEPSK